jgi:exoribonuclease R
MIDSKVGLLRTLPKPEKTTLRWLRRCSQAMGVPYPDYLAYPDWVRSLDTANPDEAALMTQAARAFRGAGYAGFDGELPEDTRHAAIGADYAHVTAPLRRLIDRFANEIVLSLAADQRPPGWILEALDSIPDTMMDASRRGRAFERAMIDFAESLTLANRVGEVFPAVATDVDDDKVTLQIRRPAIVARLHADGISLGDEISVRLTAADPAQRAVFFEKA